MIKTDATLQNVADAREALEYFDGRILDGGGAIREPSTARSQIRKAMLRLQTALEALEGV